MNDKEKLEAIKMVVDRVNKNGHNTYGIPSDSFAMGLVLGGFWHLPDSEVPEKLKVIKKIFNKSLKRDIPFALGGEEIVALLGDILSGKIEKVSDVSDVY